MKNSNTIKTIKNIVENEQHEEIHGVIVDLFTASKILQVYNALRPDSQQKMNESMNDSKGLVRMARICFDLTN